LYDKYTKAAAVTLHDTNTVSGFTGSGWDAVYIGVSGNVKMTLQGDSAAVLFKNMVQGTVYPIAAQIIQTSGEGTTATDIVVLESGGTYS